MKDFSQRLHLWVLWHLAVEVEAEVRVRALVLRVERVSLGLELELPLLTGNPVFKLV